MFNPTRGGNRGGQGLFKWDDVKSDKHRENYLGHSLKASVGRWQNNKDITWYSKDEEDKVSSHVDVDELAEIRRREAEAMAEALSGKTRRKTDSTLSQSEVKKMVTKDLEVTEDKTSGIGYGRSAFFSSIPVEETASQVNGQISEPAAAAVEKHHKKRKKEKKHKRDKRSDDDEEKKKKKKKKKRKEK